MSWFRKIILLITVTAFVVSGCLPLRLPPRLLGEDKNGGPAGQQGQKKDMPATEPNIAPLVFIADYASEAIEATGGMDVWMKTEKLALDGVVAIYEPDDSFYLTEHYFEVYPWSNSIRISAQEPLSNFLWQFSAGQFATLQGDNEKDVAPRVISYRDYAQATLCIITAPVRLVDESIGFIKEAGPVKMEGQWYYPIVQTRFSIPPDRVGGQNPESGIQNQVQPYWSKVVFFQNTDSSLVDMVWFAKVEEGPRFAGTQKKFLAVRGYDYKEVVENGVLVPTRIEIFRTDDRAVIGQRMVKIDFK